MVASFSSINLRLVVMSIAILFAVASAEMLSDWSLDLKFGMCLLRDGVTTTTQGCPSVPSHGLDLCSDKTDFYGGSSSDWDFTYLLEWAGPKDLSTSAAIWPNGNRSEALYLIPLVFNKGPKNKQMVSAIQTTYDSETMAEDARIGLEHQTHFWGW
ncbi:hypothetical protein T439DRAFT_359711 [Meredithblackwellia eburnea MCA 4105]